MQLAWRALDGSRPPPAGVVIAGAAGVGKTRMARCLAAQARSRGWARLDATATQSSSGISFGALAHLLPETPTPGALPAIDVLTRSAGWFARSAAGRRLMLSIDDAHLLDDASATLIQQLACTGVVTLIVTVRSGEPASDAIRMLWKDNSIARIELQPLSRTQVNKLLDRVLDGSADAPTRRLLWRASLGNVFLLRELVLGGISTGRLVKLDHVWHWDGELATAPSFVEVLTAQLDRLPAAERAAIEKIAIGEPLPIHTLDALGIGQAVIALERRGMVVESRQADRDVILLSHPLYGDVLRSMMPPAARRDQQQALSAALMSGGALNADDTMRVATWQLECGAKVQADLLLNAARRAAGLPDHGLAERLSRAAYAAQPDAEGRFLLVQSLRSQGRWQEAIELCRAQPDEHPDSGMQARFALEHAYAQFFGLQNPAAAISLLDTAIEELRGDVRDGCLSLRAVIALFTGDVATAERAARGIAVRDALHPEVRAQVLLCLIAALSVNGRTGEAVRTAHALRAEFMDTPGIPAIWHAQVMFSLAISLRFAGLTDEAVQVTQTYHAEVPGKDPATSAFAALSYGQSLLWIGRARSAADALVEARALMRRVDVAGLLPLAAAAAAHATALAHQQTVAEDLFAEAEDLSQRTATVFKPWLEVHLGWVLALRGEHTRARKRITDAAHRAAEQGQHCVAASALHDLARLGDPGAAVSGLSAIRDRIDSRLAGAWFDHARASACDDGAALDHAAAEFAACGTHLLSAEAAGQAARAHSTAGHRALAYASREFAEQETGMCEGASTPLMNDASGCVRLTARESEIGTLAATGKTNRQIAAQLGVSGRTIEGHLQQVDIKLGVNSRSELPRAFRPPRRTQGESM
jgi:DNA-binding CsgD family transcriptional regulator